MTKPSKLYHCTTIKKAKLYKHSNRIIKPVRGFDTLIAAMAWCVKTGRSIIYEVSAENPNNLHKLPDHHIKGFGEAYWIDEDVKTFNCVFSVEKNNE